MSPSTGTVLACQWSLLDEKRVAVASNNKVEAIRSVAHGKVYSHFTYCIVYSVHACQWSLLDGRGQQQQDRAIRTVPHVIKAYSHVNFSHVRAYWIIKGWPWPATTR
jgi:hypothetical protein